MSDDQRINKQTVNNNNNNSNNNNNNNAMEATSADPKPTDADNSPKTVGKSPMTAEPPTIIPEPCAPGLAWVKSDAVMLHQPSNGCALVYRITQIKEAAQIDRQFKKALNQTVTENNNVLSTLQVDAPNRADILNSTEPSAQSVVSSVSLNNLKKCDPLHLNGDMLSGDGEKLDPCLQCATQMPHDLKRHLTTEAKTSGQTLGSAISAETDSGERNTGAKIQLDPDSTKNSGGSYFTNIADNTQTTYDEEKSCGVDIDVRKDQEREEPKGKDTVKQRFVCVLCNFATHKKTSLQFHMKSHEGQPGPFRCRLCEFVAKTTSHVRVHSRQHVQPAACFRCDRCDFKARSQRRLDAHLRRQHTEGRARCTLCVFTAGTQRGLNIHVRRRHFKSDADDLERQKNDDITEHLEKHGKTGLLQCPLCDYLTKWKKNLSKHIRDVHKTHNFVCKCPDCEHTFRTVSLLRLHVRRKHTGERPFQCPHCSYAALVSSHLERHILRHTGDRPFMCEECGYMAATRDLLSNHLRTHSGERPYRCELCGYAARRRHHLQGHMAKHAPVKPERRFKCEFCDYAAVRRFHLVRHMTRHTGEKPFKCNMCGYSTVDNSRLQAHIRAHTGEKPFRCSTCDFATARKDHLKQHVRCRHK